jgi:FMN phosphatase YigB (HAD superfamily)
VIESVLVDAAGTLFETAEPVGETCARFARDEGMSVDAGALDRAFRAARAAGLAALRIDRVGVRDRATITDLGDLRTRLDR